MIKATIDDAKIYRISKLWRRKPHGLKFNETEAIVVTMRTEDGRTPRETFYLCLKPDGTFNVQTVSKDSGHLRRLRLAKFLKHYHFTDDVKHYNLKQNIGEWKGREVQIIESEGSTQIYVP